MTSNIIFQLYYVFPYLILYSYIVTCNQILYFTVNTLSHYSLIRFWNLLGDEDPEGIAAESEATLCCTYSPSGRAVAVG